MSQIIREKKKTRSKPKPTVQINFEREIVGRRLERENEL
jgi:hypothetical protein